jgi:hypothetical protein
LKAFTKTKQAKRGFSSHFQECHALVDNKNFYHSYYFFRRFDWPKELQITAYK